MFSDTKCNHEVKRLSLARKPEGFPLKTPPSILGLDTCGFPLPHAFEELASERAE